MSETATEVWKREHKETWNAAIEAAAEVAYSKGYNIIGTDAIIISSEIRKLKK